MNHRLLVLAGLLAALAAPNVDAQNDEADASKPSKKSRPERLFRSREPLVLTLRAPYKTIFKDRDTLSPQAVPALLVAHGAGENGKTDTFAVNIATRGHFRLRRSTCSFAPLKVSFDKAKNKGTLFSGQGSLKLVTHCQNGSNYEQNVLLEEAAYRAYNLLTPLSHLTRLAKVTYLDTEDSTKSVSRYAFFLEDDDEMAKRNGARVVMQTGGQLADMEPAQLDLVSVFEYMIGNTDWSVYAIHNIRLLENPEQIGFYYPVAYDFDFSGLVGAPYAVPDSRLPIKQVKERLYRGTCRKVDEIAPTLATFRSKRDSIESVFTSIKDLEPRRLNDVRRFLAEFFEDINEDKRFGRALEYPCSINR